MADRKAFEEGTKYTYFLRVIDTCQAHVDSILELGAILKRKKDLESLRDSLGLNQSKVDFAYATCRRFYSKYYKKYPKLLRQGLKTLDGKLEGFNRVHQKLNERYFGIKVKNV